MNHQSSLDKTNLLESLGLNPSKKTIIYISGGFYAKYGWFPEYDKEILARMLDTAKSHTNLQLIVRLHPMDDGKYQRSLIRQYSSVNSAITRGERNDLMWASDFVVTVNSSLALDALILHKLVFMLENSTRIAPGIDLGKAVVQFNLENLKELIQRALDEPDHFTELSERATHEVVRHSNHVDGRASMRIAQLALGLTRQSASHTQYGSDRRR
jgi:CDP-glycerol glycerophosphotransferase (TagB/SpsB family)